MSTSSLCSRHFRLQLARQRLGADLAPTDEPCAGVLPDSSSVRPSAVLVMHQIVDAVRARPALSPSAGEALAAITSAACSMPLIQAVQHLRHVLELGGGAVDIALLQQVAHAIRPVLHVVLAQALRGSKLFRHLLPQALRPLGQLGDGAQRRAARARSRRRSASLLGRACSRQAASCDRAATTSSPIASPAPPCCRPIRSSSSSVSRSNSTMWRSFRPATSLPLKGLRCAAAVTQATGAQLAQQRLFFLRQLCPGDGRSPAASTADLWPAPVPLLGWPASDAQAGPAGSRRDGARPAGAPSYQGSAHAPRGRAGRSVGWGRPRARAPQSMRGRPGAESLVPRKLLLAGKGASAFSRGLKTCRTYERERPTLGPLTVSRSRASMKATTEVPGGDRSR